MNYFTENEIACQCGCGHNVTPPEFLERINKAREIAGIPFNVNSWNRCQTHNDKQQGSAKHSPHIRGIAVDIVTKNDTERFIVIDSLLKAGFNRILIYPKRYFIHVDSDETQEQYIMRIMP